MKGPERIAFLGDIHCGSHYGLWPIEELPSKGSRFIGVRYLMECWEHLVNKWPEIDLLVLTGDLIDGKQPKSKGVGIFTADLAEQAEMASKVLKPFVDKAKKVVRVWGTPYHESYDNILGIVDSELGVDKVSQVLDIRLGDAHNAILNVAHHPASGTALYQGTVADRESLWSQITANDRKVPDVRWIVRAHKHTYFLQETRNRTIVMLPCWQLPTPHSVKQNYWRFQPSLGGVLMLRDELHDSGYRFCSYLFDSPEKEIIKWPSL